MSRFTAFDIMCAKRVSGQQLIWDNIVAPPLMAIFNQYDVDSLDAIATSIRYNSNISKKRSAIDAIMVPRGFYRAYSGTNRLVYKFVEDERFCAKVAIDKVGMKDTPAEFINQQYFAPFCCKIFQPSQSGVIGLIERVHPITSIEEFASCANDVFNMLVGVFLGRFVADDIGIHAYMNYGIRVGFGPVLLDFPYFYELDGDKLRCNNLVDSPLGIKVPCGGTIDYDGSFDFLVCPKCGKHYKAIELAKTSEYHIPLFYNEQDAKIAKLFQMARARIIDNGRVVIDSGASSSTILSKEELMMNNFGSLEVGMIPVDKTIRGKRSNVKASQKAWTALQEQYYHDLAEKNSLRPAVVNSVFDLDENAQHEPAKNVRASTTTTNPIKTTKALRLEDAMSYNGGFMELVEEVSDGPINNTYTTKSPKSDVVEEPVEERASSVGDADADVEEVESEETTAESTETAESEQEMEEVIPQSEVEKMVNEVKEQCNPTQTEVTSTVLEPEEDATNPMSSPMSRPYSKSPFPVSVFNDSKINAADQRAAMEYSVTSGKNARGKKYKIPGGKMGDDRKNREERRKAKRGF